jgi:transglutaminase-like putative cysteine protease
MRFFSTLRIAVLSSICAAPLLLHAEFQAPTPEELKMTVDPAYPDAAAIVLNRESKWDDVLHYHSEYRRIKVLKTSAIELGTVTLGYFKEDAVIDPVEGRTIHADGTVIPFSAKWEDLRAREGSSEYHRVAFTLPGVEVGSIIEYHFLIHYHQVSTIYAHVQPPDWELQGRIPIREEHFVYNAPPSLFTNEPAGRRMNEKSGRLLPQHSYGIYDRHHNPLTDMLWYTDLPNGKKLAPNTLGQFSLELTDMPPLQNEDWMPPIESRRYQVKFYMTAQTSGAEYWRDETKDWLEDVNQFAEPTKAIKDVAASLVAAGDSDLDKAKKLYAAVEALDNTDFSRKKSEEELKEEGLKPAKRAEDTWQQKSGNGDDIAMLYLALLRGAGLTAYPAKIADRRSRVFDQNYLSFRQLNALVIVLNDGGKEIVLDPAEKMCPFGVVSWTHSGAGGVRQTDKGNGPWVTPLLLFSINTETRRAELTVGAGGELNGKLQFSFTGQDALQWRQNALRVDEAELNRQFEAWITSQIPVGMTAHLTRFAKLDDPNSDLGAYATVTGIPGGATAKRIVLQGSFFTTPDKRTFTEQTNRTQPVDMHYALQVKDGVLYHLPAGYTVESLPQAAPISWTGKAMLQMKATATGNDVLVTRTLARAFTILGADEYSQLRDFYQKVAEADQQQLVLKLSPETKGN